MLANTLVSSVQDQTVNVSVHHHRHTESMPRQQSMPKQQKTVSIKQDITGTRNEAVIFIETSLSHKK